MMIFINIFNCIAQSLGFSLTILFLGTTIRKSFSEFLKVFFIVFVCDIITFGAFEYLTIPFTIIVLLIYFYKINRSIIQNFVIIIICILIQFVVLIIISVLLLSIIKNLEYYKESISYNLFFGLAYVGFVLSLKKVLNKLGFSVKNNKIYQQLNGIIPNILVLNLICILAGVFIISMFYETAMFDEIIFILFLFIFVIFSFTSYFIYNSYIKMETEKAETNKELEVTIKFQDSIKKMYNDVMNFKHDYIKIYSTFQIFIINNDIEALKKYFNENITPLQEYLHLQKFNIESLVNVKDIALQGIIYTAILNAESHGISVSIEADEPIYIKMQGIDICRIIGIFLDNAIQENENIKSSYINISLFKKQKNTAIIIENSCSKEVNISDIMNNSIKSDNRGRGLNIVKSIINKYSNVVNNTYIKDNKFIQEIWIEEEDSE